MLQRTFQNLKPSEHGHRYAQGVAPPNFGSVSGINPNMTNNALQHYGKGKNSGNQHFLLFLQCFLTLSK